MGAVTSKWQRSTLPGRPVLVGGTSAWRMAVVVGVVVNFRFHSHSGVRIGVRTWRQASIGVIGMLEGRHEGVGTKASLSFLAFLVAYPNQTMKFCKNLQRVVDISDPEWSPYWVNYKMLKVRPSRKTQWIDLMKIRVLSPSLVRTNLRFF